MTLVSTEPVLDNPGVTVQSVTTAEQMAEALQASVPGSDVLFMAAAVSDFTVSQSTIKLRREGTHALDLVPTVDILQALGSQKNNTSFVGFCLADQSILEATAREKLEAKGLDYIVANTVENLGADLRSATVYGAGKTSPVAQMDQVSVLTMADRLLGLVK